MLWSYLCYFYSRIWDLNSGSQLRSIQQDMGINAIYPYCNDTCAVLVTYANIIAQNLQTEEVYYNEYHSSTYGKSSDMSNNKQFFILSNAEAILLFKTEQQKLVSNIYLI